VGLAFGQGAVVSGTRAVVVVDHGRLVYERYAPGFDRHTRLAGWSMTKGITSAMAGILVGQHLLDLHAPAPVEQWQKDDRGRISVEELLHMNSGLSWWEFYAGPSDATRMLFEEADMGKFAERSALRHQPGMVFNYSSGTANILSSIIRSKIGAGYYRWPYEQLFYKIGMYSAVLEPDAGGTFVGSSYCYATARDWARFGLLYLRDGVWEGQRVLPEGWVAYTRKGGDYGPGKGYGAMWWLNTDERRFPGVPSDCYFCDGYEGQYVWVIPSRDLVVVRLALEHGGRLRCSDFLKGIISAL
jgi:CubicO group peptidase (beta-lactamase class C family)